MTVQAADFIAIQPYTQTVLNIGIGIISWEATDGRTTIRYYF
jgi:hypothetical protein